MIAKRPAGWGAVIACIVCLSTVACRSAPERPVAAGAEHDSERAFPPGWEAYRAFDERDLDWAPSGSTLEETPLAAHWRQGDGMLFQLTSFDGNERRSWYVLLRAPEERETGLSFFEVNEESGFDAVYRLALETKLAQLLVEWDGVPVQRLQDLPVLAPGRGFVEIMRAGWAAGQVPRQPTIDPETGSARIAEATVGEFRGEHGPLPLIGVVGGEVCSHFLTAVQAHPELGPLLKQVIERPSLLSIIRSGGVSLKMRMLYSGGSITTEELEGLEEAIPVARIPISIRANGRLALTVQLLAVEPYPPFHLAAGIVGFTAQHPSDPSAKVELRLLGACRVQETGG